MTNLKGQYALLPSLLNQKKTMININTCFKDVFKTYGYDEFLIDDGSNEVRLLNTKDKKQKRVNIFDLRDQMSNCKLIPYIHMSEGRKYMISAADGSLKRFENFVNNLR